MRMFNAPGNWSIEYNPDFTGVIKLHHETSKESMKIPYDSFESQVISQGITSNYFQIDGIGVHCLIPGKVARHFLAKKVRQEEIKKIKKLDPQTLLLRYNQ